MWSSNFSLFNALEKMPSHVKFLKDILYKKRRLNEFEIVALTQETRNIFKKRILEKMGNPRSFVIPCLISGIDLGRALCDLGVSISLMLLFVLKKFEISVARPTTVSL